jgi:hypothetical protein
MQITYTHAAGLDVHKKTVVACIFTPGPQGKPHKEIRTFGTMTHDLLEAGLQSARRQLHGRGGQRAPH